ncbi:MAG: NUDIX domain-containing protein [Patescibacteria group bacterium]|nr:NUDIX domain-containing protein [Patescibacteria group bacterium]
MITRQDEDEYLDLVDENDNVIGKKKRSIISAENLSNFRVVNAFLENSKGELWIPRRTAHKRIFPLCLDMSMGGHVQSGETYEEALKREIKEELNLNTEEERVSFLGRMTPHGDHVSAFMKVFKIETDKTPDYNKADFMESFWLKPQEVLEKVSEGDKVKEDLPKILKRFFL